MSILFYHRPDYVAKFPGPLSVKSCAKYIELLGNRGSIPDELSFENVIANKTLPPCSLGDFMDFLTYVQHDAENLQFYLWLRDYTNRFEAKLDKALSPEWTYDLGRTVSQRHGSRGSGGSFPNQADHEPTESEYTNPPEMIPDELTQPFREEIDKVIAHYIAHGSPRELNISARDRAEIITALRHTTHPSAFALINTVVEITLRGRAHPNFIRWSICNGNKPRVLFVCSIGILWTVGGCVAATLLTLSKVSRWWRVITLLPLLFGICSIIASIKGLCIILHSRYTRNVRPWEQFGDDLPSFVEGDDGLTIAEKRRETRAGLSMFGPSNSFVRESWVEKYKKKPLLRKVFDEKTWVKDETIRKMQDNIVLQSHLWSVIVSVPLVALFVALPSGNYY